MLWGLQGEKGSRLSRAARPGPDKCGCRNRTPGTRLSENLMNKLTEFEIRQIAEKWATRPGDDPLLERIRIQNAIRHAQRILEEKNRGLEHVKVRIQATPMKVNEKAWGSMWRHFDAMMRHFNKLFD